MVEKCQLWISPADKLPSLNFHKEPVYNIYIENQKRSRYENPPSGAIFKNNVNMLSKLFSLPQTL